MVGSIVKCRVKFCEKLEGSRGVMCVDHWSLVPERLKGAIWDAYRPGATASAAFASPTYRKLVTRAVRFAEARDRNNELDRDRKGVRKR